MGTTGARAAVGLRWGTGWMGKVWAVVEGVGTAQAQGPGKPCCGGEAGAAPPDLGGGGAALGRVPAARGWAGGAAGMGSLGGELLSLAPGSSEGL